MYGGPPQPPPPGGLGGAPPPGGPIGYYTPPAGSGGRPAVIIWFRIFAMLSALIYMAFGAMFGAFGGVDRGSFILFLVTLPFVITSLMGVFIPFKPWGWTLGLIVIAFGMLSCLAPLSIVLVIFWNRPEVKAAFRRL